MLVARLEVLNIGPLNRAERRNLGFQLVFWRLWGRHTTGLKCVPCLVLLLPFVELRCCAYSFRVPVKPVHSKCGAGVPPEKKLSARARESRRAGDILTSAFGSAKASRYERRCLRGERGSMLVAEKGEGVGGREKASSSCGSSF